MTDNIDAVDANAYMRDLLLKLRERFGERLLFLGIQGSYRRGEATGASDVDAVVILDQVNLADLAVYREIVDSLPHPEKACGFIAGAEEIRGWPKQELFQFVRDTEAVSGDLSRLVPEPSEEDIRLAVRVGASGIYHFACHTFVHNPDASARMEMLRGLYKGAYFVLIQTHFLETGVYAGTRKALTAALSGRERRIMEIGNDWDAAKAEYEADPDALFAMLVEWAGTLIRL